MHPFYSTAILLCLVAGNWVVWRCAITMGQVAGPESSQQEMVEDMRDIADLAQDHLWGVHPPPIAYISYHLLVSLLGDRKANKPL